MYKSIIYVLFFVSVSSYSDELDVLRVDRVVPQNLKLSFPNDENIKPRSSAFKLINYVVMSNEKGERLAVITITNSSTGSRILQAGHVMALFANGKRESPKEFKLNFKGEETQSITVSFGENKYPILSLYTGIEI